MKKLILIALIISAVTGIVFAQVDLPVSNWTSPQSTATQGRMRSAADNFIRADAYGDVKFDKFFAMAGYNSDTKVNLGFATKAGDLYIGTYYGGTFWANIPNTTYTEADIAFNGLGNKKVKTYTANGLPDLTGTAPDNSLAVVIGVADMGFRLAVNTNKRLFKEDSDFKDNAGDFYKSYEMESGQVTPQLLWSMTKNLTNNGIKPYAAVELGFNKSLLKTKKYKSNSTDYDEELTGVNLVPATPAVLENVGYTDIKAYLGLGGYTLLNKDGFRLSTDLDYALTLKDYNNEYEYENASSLKRVKTGFKGTVVDNSGTITLTEISGYNAHTITPSLSGQWSGGPLSFRFKVNLPVGLEGKQETGMDIKSGSTDGSLEKEGNDQKVTTVNFNPNIRLAAQWKIIPNLTLNLGGRINVGRIQSVTTEGKRYTNGSETANSSFKTVANTSPTAATGNNNNEYNSLTTGVTFNVTNNFTFEAATGVNSGTINVFGNTNGTNGLFYFTNLLITLKY